MSLAKAAQLPLGLFALFVVLVWVFFGFSWLLFFAFLVALFICRSRAVSVPSEDEGTVIAPICGRVEQISSVNHANLGECVELIIKNALFDEGVIRAPAKMRVKEIRARHGLLGFEMPNLNERVLIIGQNGAQRLAMRVSAGCLERGVMLYEGLGELEAGEQLGFSLNSSVALLLPKDTRLLVSTGDEVRAGALFGYLHSRKKIPKIAAKNSKSTKNLGKNSKAVPKNSSGSANLKTKIPKATKNSAPRGKKSNLTLKNSQNEAKLKENSSKNSKNSKTAKTKTAKNSSKTTNLKSKNSVKTPKNSNKGTL